MSTRANIAVIDSCEEILFYRHSDGYPEGTLPTLKTFLCWVKGKSIRDNASQSSGWLIMLGAKEYEIYGIDNKKKRDLFKPNTVDGDYSFWKVGAYEPTSFVSGDIEFYYEIDLTKKEIRVYGCSRFGEALNPKAKLIDTIK